MSEASTVYTLVLALCNLYDCMLLRAPLPRGFLLLFAGRPRAPPVAWASVITLDSTSVITLALLHRAKIFPRVGDDLRVTDLL